MLLIFRILILFLHNTECTKEVTIEFEKEEDTMVCIEYKAYV